MTKTLLITLSMLALSSMSFNAASLEQVNVVTKKQVDNFLQKNRSNLLLKYHCPQGQNVSECSVYCSSGGAEFISANHVQYAYYAERLSRINSSLAGFFLILDVDNKKEEQDLWATLQTESSCYFKGMVPVLSERNGK